MKLNDAKIMNMIDVNGESVSSVTKFANELKSSKLIADLYINDKNVKSVTARLFENNGYLIASIDAGLRFNPEIAMDSLIIKVHYINSDEVLFQSQTDHLNFPLENNDYDVDIYFKVMSTLAANMLRCHLPDTKFNLLKTSHLPVIDLSDIEDDKEEVTVNVTGALFTITQRESDSTDIYHFWLTCDDLPNTEVDCVVTFDFGNDDPQVTVHNTTVGEEIRIVKGMEGWNSFHSSLGNTITLHVVCDELNINCSLEKELIVE